jgi:multimeric flavodoxin WrbA
MAKKILILSSSPRKGGNSDTLCDEFMKGAKDAGHNVKKISFNGKEINYCNGCNFCSTNDFTKCAIKDDMIQILDEMLASDTIVMATPLYFYTMCAQMKTIIDRCYACYTRIANKDFYFIITAADGGVHALDRAIEEFRGFLACLPGAKEKGILRGIGVSEAGDVKDTNYLKKAYEMGNSV